MSDDRLASRVPVPVLTVDRASVVVRANDAAKQYFDANATPGRSFVDAVQESSVDAMRPLLSCDEETRRRVSFSLDGRTRRLKVVATPVADDVEPVVDTVAERDRYARLVETVSDPMDVLGENGYVETVNDALAETYGYTRGDIMGSHATLRRAVEHDVALLTAGAYHESHDCFKHGWLGVDEPSRQASAFERSVTGR